MDEPASDVPVLDAPVADAPPPVVAAAPVVEEPMAEPATPAVAELTSAVAEPASAPVPEPLPVEPAPIPSTEPLVEIKTEPTVAPVAAVIPPIPPPQGVEETLIGPVEVTPAEQAPAKPLESPVAEPAVIIAPTPETKQPTALPDIPAAVLALSDDELRIAASWYIRKHQAEIGHKGVLARQANMRDKLAGIESYIKQHGSVHIPRLARELNLSPGLAAHYLQMLVKQKRIKATGWSGKRTYTIAQ